MTTSVEELARQLRVDAVRASAEAGSGHPTSSMSAAELMAVLLSGFLVYDFSEPDHPGNDRLIFSKGHASPLLYGMLRAAGAITEDELLTYRQTGSRLEGHPTPRLPWVDVATGSLGQGLPFGVGMAMTARDLDRLPYRVWVLCGDSELAEGSMWEAFEHAGTEGLAGLTVIVDVNRLGQRGPTRHQWDTSAYARRIAAFGWHTIELDGHDVAQIGHAYTEAIANDRPTAILARTRKGRGVAAVEDQEGKHGKPIPSAEEAIDELGGVSFLRVPARPPAERVEPFRFAVDPPLRLPVYEVGELVATRTAFGDALSALASARGEVVGLDGEVADSTRLETFAKAHPERFFECYIAEQQLVAAAVGMQTRGWIPYVATFAAFLTRAYDFIRMAAISRANLCLVGSHAGVAIGPDGPSQMALEDIAMLRAVHGSTVLYPCDANQTTALVAEMADWQGIRYLRTTRGETPTIYPAGESFPIGGSKVLRQSAHDAITLVGAGVTVPECLEAAGWLARDGIVARVIDLYSVKPLDVQALHAAAMETGRIITVEDHWPEGGLGDAVLAALATAPLVPKTAKLAVYGLPASAPAGDQLRLAGIDVAAIRAAALDLARE